MARRFSNEAFTLMSRLLALTLLLASSGMAFAAPEDLGTSATGNTVPILNIDQYGNCPGPDCDPDESGLDVRYKDSQSSFDWKVPGFRLSSEYDDPRTGNSQQVGENDRYLLVFAWTGGNHCCWPVLVFDVRDGKYLGDYLPSNTPIRILPDRKGCALTLEAVPYDEKVTQEALSDKNIQSAMELDEAQPTKDYCFKDGSFKLVETIPSEFQKEQYRLKHPQKNKSYPAPTEADLIGNYSCTFIDPVDYPAFRCAISKKGSKLELRKLSGSQRIKGEVTITPTGFTFNGIFYCPHGSCTHPESAYFARTGLKRYEAESLDIYQVLLIKQ
jgi:hypothetical protein